MASKSPDLDFVRILLVLDTHPTEIVTWTPVTDRFHARLACQAFGSLNEKGEPLEKWDGERVKRALIVEQAT